MALGLADLAALGLAFQQQPVLFQLPDDNRNSLR